MAAAPGRRRSIHDHDHYYIDGPVSESRVRAASDSADSESEKFSSCRDFKLRPAHCTVMVVPDQSRWPAGGSLTGTVTVTVGVTSRLSLTV
jgi:hypothetical protein